MCGGVCGVPPLCSFTDGGLLSCHIHIPPPHTHAHTHARTHTHTHTHTHTQNLSPHTHTHKNPPEGHRSRVLYRTPNSHPKKTKVFKRGLDILNTEALQAEPTGDSCKPIFEKPTNHLPAPNPRRQPAIKHATLNRLLFCLYYKIGCQLRDVLRPRQELR